MNLMTLLQEQTLARPDAIAIAAADARLSFRQLDAASARTATLLSRSGLVQGDAVLVFQPMSAALYVSLLAIFRLGLVAMFLDPSAGRAHIERCCRLYPPKGFIGSPKAHLLRLLSPALRRIPLKFSTGCGLPGATRLGRAQTLAPLTAIAAVGIDTAALVTFTSGSTGEPKAAVRSHGFLLAQHRVLAHHLALRAGETDLCTLPIFVLANLASGVTSLIPDADLRRPGAVEPGPVWAQLESQDVSRGTASPAFFERLAEHAEHVPARRHALRRLFTGGAPVFPNLLQRLQALAPHAEVVAVYGSTEAEPIAHVPWNEVSADDLAAMRGGQGLLAGPPVPEITLRILPAQWGTPLGPYSSDAFEQLCLPAGQPGEIVVSGEHVLPGYLHGRGDLETKFEVEGRRWHRTGDLGYLDARGRVWLLGRAGARISDSRGTLYPFCVECAAACEAGVRRSALAAWQGKRVLAVEAGDGFDASRLAQRLAWAELDEVRLVPRIPVDARHNAKVDYPALTRLLERG